MLQLIRRNLKHLSIVVWIGIAAFVIGGAFLFVSGPFRMGQDVAVKVNKTTISMENFQNRYQELYRFYSKLFSQNFTEEKIKKLNLRQKAIDSLIDETLLIQEVRKRNIKTTDEEVQEKIENMSIFWDRPGHFSQQRYLNILKTNGIQPRKFEASIKIQICIDKLKKDVTSKVLVSDKKVKDYINKNYAQINLAYVKIDRKSLIKNIKTEVKDIQIFYNEHKTMFKRPPEIEIVYTKITPKYVEKNTSINEEEILNYYNNHQKSFTVPEKRKVYHILVKIPPRKNDDKEWEKGKEKIDKIYRELKRGKNFTTLAKMYSEDPFSKKEGGCLGYITRDEVTDEFKDIFQMEKGKISKPFKTIYGYHIAKVTDINPRHVLPLKDVKQKIIKTLKSNKARENIFREAKRIQVELRKNPEKFEQITESKGLKAIKTGFFSIRDVKEPLNKDIIEQSLYMDKDKISNPIKSNENYIVFKLLDKKPAYIPKLEEIKQKVIKEYKNEKSKELLRKKAGEIKKALSSKNLKTLAIKENLKLKQTPYFNRINKTYSIPCLKDNVFSLKKNEGDFCIFDDIAYVYQLKKRKAIDKTEYNELKDKVKESLEQKEREKAIQDFLKQLKAKAKIKINEKALSQWT